MIKDLFGDFELEEMGSQQPPSSQAMGIGSSPCDFACDFCKEGRGGLARRKRKMAPDYRMEVMYEGYD
jgi:hypothetical protein